MDLRDTRRKNPQHLPLVVCGQRRWRDSQIRLGSVLRGKSGSFASGGKDLHIRRSVLSIDYRIKMWRFSMR